VANTRPETRLGDRARLRGPSRALEADQSNRDEGVSRHWIARLAKALGDLEDRIALNRNPLAHLAYVERLAGEKYRGQILPRGLALRCILLDCVDQVCAQLADEPGLAKPRDYLRLRADGYTCKDISRQLSLSREHVSREIRPKALQLLAEQFIAVTTEGRYRTDML
jgi:AraC-like DNA-binding protein